jgi:cobalamin biosynthesis protein CobD/CbiB
VLGRDFANFFESEIVSADVECVQNNFQFQLLNFLTA